MTPSALLETLTLLLETPGAVPKVRDLILWSAFSGGFSGMPREQGLPADMVVADRPVLPSVPSSWLWTRGADTFDVIRGVTYKKDDSSDSPEDGLVAILRANNIGRVLNFDDLVYVPRDNVRDEQMLRRDDILIAMSSGSKNLVGKAAPLVVEFEGAFGAFCGVVRSKNTMLESFLALYFQSPQYVSWVTAAGRGIGINNLGKGDLESLPIPVPPREDQQRIIAKVNDLTVLVDRLEADLAAARDTGEKLLDAVVAEICSR